MSVDQDYFSLPFVNQRRMSPLTCRDQHGHLHPLSKAQCLSTETTLVSPSSARGERARWHAETNMVICTLCRRLNVFQPRLLQSSFPSRDNQVRWHAETIMVIYLFLKTSMSFDQDYYSLICLPETIKSMGMRRQSWSSTFIVFKTIIVFFAFQR